MTAKHTYIGRHETEIIDAERYTYVKYWATNVVTIDWDKNIVTLDTGGYFTPTTKKRMNQASDEFGLGYRVQQIKGDWYVFDTTYGNYPMAEFESNKVTISKLSGEVINTERK